jgi:hypothetical protein
MSALDIQALALIAMTATIRNLSVVKNVPVEADRFAQVAEAAMEMLSTTEVYGLGKGHRTSVIAAAAAVNRCLDIVAATRRAIVRARRQHPIPDIDAITAQVQQSPNSFIPAKARRDIYRWPNDAELAPDAGQGRT